MIQFARSVVVHGKAPLKMCVQTHLILCHSDRKIRKTERGFPGRGGGDESGVVAEDGARYASHSLQCGIGQAGPQRETVLMQSILINQTLDADAPVNKPRLMKVASVICSVDGKGRVRAQAFRNIKATANLIGNPVYEFASIREMFENTLHGALSKDLHGTGALQGNRPANPTVELGSPTSALEGGPVQLGLSAEVNSSKADTAIRSCCLPPLTLIHAASSCSAQSGLSILAAPSAPVSDSIDFQGEDGRRAGMALDGSPLFNQAQSGDCPIAGLSGARG